MAIKVLIVDDSPLIRGVLTEVLNNAPDIQVVGTAEDPFDARDKIKLLQPDVLTLDIEMPKMDGISFLKNLMRLRPMPVIMISTLTAEGAPATLQALELGAIDFIEKPKANVADGLMAYQSDLIEKVRIASLASVQHHTKKQLDIGSPPVPSPSKLNYKSGHLITIGASTGGTEAIKELVNQLPADCPPVVITQHIPEMFSLSFAQRLNTTAKLNVHQAIHNQKIETGNVYIAPGDDHLTVKRVSGGYICQLDKGEKINRHRPAVDKLFLSVAEATKGNSTAVLLTGMGADGALGLLHLKDSGTHTIAQDKATSVVWGMPGAAVELGAANYVLPLKSIASKIVQLATSKK
jgi:two-component system chemotaxis response regulator CheB